MVLWVAAMRPPPHLHYSPNQLWAAMVWAPVVGRHGQAGWLAQMGNEGKAATGAATWAAEGG